MLAESRGEKENEADVNELNYWLLCAAQDDDIATARQVVRDGADVNV